MAEIYGIMLNRSEIKQPTESFSVQEFFVDCSEFDRFSGQKKFENKLKFQVSNSKIEELRKVNRGDLIKIFFTPQGREYEKQDGTGKGHAQNLNVWKIEVAKASGTQLEQQVTQAVYQPVQQTQEDEDDDLPF